MKKYNILKVTVIAVGLISIQSCFVAKDYNRPTEIVTTEANFRTDELVKNNEESISRLSWQQIFTDAQLQSLIKKGLANNLDIRFALQNIAITEAYLKQGKAGYFPTLSVGPKYSYSRTSANTYSGEMTGNQSFSQFELSGTMSWEADIWGKIKSQHKSAEANYLQTVAAHQAVKTNIISAIANAYYQLIALDEQKRVAEITVLNRTQSLETTKALKEAGSVTQVAVNQTEAQKLNAEALIIDIDNNIKLLENVISVLIGENPQTIQRSTIDSQVVTTNLAVGVPADLLENRPDVKAAEFGVMSAFHQVNVAEANFYPSLTISASGGLQSMDIDNLFNTQALFANVLGGLTQPIFNRRAIKTQKEVSLAQQEQALIDYKASILNASKEVSDALYSYDAATKKVTIKEQEAKLYNESVTYSEELLNYGMANYLEVITARDAALSADLSIINTKLAKLQAVVELYRALGGGIE